MAHLDLVARELENVDALLADLARDGDRVPAREARERLVASVRALDDERRRYRELFELAPSAYVITDPASAIVEANAAARELLGLEQGRPGGKRISTLVSPEGRPRFRRLLRELASDDAPGEHEFALGGPGRGFTASLTVGHIEHGGEAGSLRWLIRDVTERRRAEEEARRFAGELEQRVRERTRELEHEQALLRAVIEQMPAGVTITDAATGRLLIANAQAWDVARTRFEAQEGLEPLIRALGALTERGTGVLETTGPGGEAGAIEVNAAPLRDGDGGVTARVAVFRDVTGRDRLERAEREFITNAAHELQTPLTAITSAAEVLQAGAKEIPADRDRFLTHIQRECDRLARLVRALLVLARAQSHGRLADAERLPLRALLEDVAGTLHPAEGVSVEVACPPRLTALANRDVTEQALVSLAGNAAKYTAQGTIRLAARALDAERVAIEVRDTGPGIAAAERALVRQRFYRGGGRDRSGFGLGLAIAEQSAQALGGALELEPAPEPGGGTIARLVLPRRRRR